LLSTVYQFCISNSSTPDPPPPISKHSVFTYLSLPTVEDGTTRCLDMSSRHNAKEYIEVNVSFVVQVDAKQAREAKAKQPAYWMQQMARETRRVEETFMHRFERPYVVCTVFSFVKLCLFWCKQQHKICIKPWKDLPREQVQIYPFLESEKHYDQVIKKETDKCLKNVAVQYFLQRHHSTEGFSLLPQGGQIGTCLKKPFDLSNFQELCSLLEKKYRIL